MEKIVEIDIKSETDLYDKYNHSRVSQELVSYIIDESYRYISKDKIILVINNYLGKEIQCKRLVDEGLRLEYEKSIRRHQRNNIQQIFYLILGIVTLFLASFFDDGVFKELMVIGGWVFIWELVEVELFSETSGMKKRRTIKKILKFPIIERQQ